ncbi:MAG: winged helix DNA-binding domain-containing protein [Hyphomonas sp.]
MSIPRITNDQVRWFRFRRSGLLDPHDSPADAARQLIGIQAQAPISADLALFNRVENVTLSSLENARNADRQLIRMWGQRNTVHIYAAEDWPLLHHSIRDRSVIEQKLKKSSLMRSFEQLVRESEERLENGEQLTFKTISAFDEYKTILDAKDQWMGAVKENAFPDWLIAAAVIMRLVRKGVVCHGPDAGSESTFVHRHHWLPDLGWTEDEADIRPIVANRYLRSYGPATPKDISAYFGNTIPQVQKWIDAARDALVVVDRAGTESLARAADLEVLSEQPPPADEWPVQLLHRFDPYVLGTVGIKDKDWLIDADAIKQVWRPGGYIEAVILDGGRVVGTWRYARKTKGLHFLVKPFRTMSQRLDSEVRKRIKATAEFLERDVLSIDVD